MSRTRAAGAFVGVLGAGASALIGLRYRRDLRRARERVASGSRLVDTPRGKIECGGAGEGPPVLVVHGAGGGFDQGLEFAAPLAGGGFRVVAMSRFGYLRTPLPADGSAAAQADAHAALLDALEIPRVSVVGASAGSPSSVQFALRHPDRTAALVLMVPALYPMRGAPKERSATAGLILDTALRSDFLFWSASRVARGAMVQTVLGTPASIFETASAQERARLERVLEHVQPVSRRRLGLLNDAAVLGALPRYELERIAAPALVVGLEDCQYGTYAAARYSAEHIPGARFVSYPQGGHLWAGHQGEVMAEVAAFLRKAA